MIKVVACGKVKDSWLQKGIQEYMKRIQPYEKIEIVEVADEKAPQSNSEAENIQVKNKEGEKMLKKIKPDEYVILLDLAGKQMDSVVFANTIDQIHTQGKSKITFVIGGSLGVSDGLIQRSNMRMCLSKNTFPHQLCRLLVVEQVYRAFRILNNEPYHK